MKKEKLNLKKWGQSPERNVNYIKKKLKKTHDICSNKDSKK